MCEVDYKILLPDDMVRYKSIRRQCLTNYPDNFGTKIDEETRLYSSKYETLILSPSFNGSIFGAYHETQLIGICGFIRGETIKTSHRGELIQVYVDPVFSGRGIGLKLINKTISKAFEHIQIELILLSAVMNNNKATRLYQKIGFKEYATLPNYFKDGNRYWQQVFMYLHKEDYSGYTKI